MNKTFLGLGSNVGDRLENLIRSAIEINKLADTKIVNVSGIYETKPFGVTEQNDFFNAVIEVDTELKIDDFHAATKKIEEKLGREKTFRWGPRKIDIDILLFNDEIIRNENLTVPHKDLLNRDFVLLPLLEICGEFVYPVDGRLVDKKDLRPLEKYVTKEKISEKEFMLLISEK